MRGKQQYRATVALDYDEMLHIGARIQKCLVVAVVKDPFRWVTTVVLEDDRLPPWKPGMIPWHFNHEEALEQYLRDPRALILPPNYQGQR